jgi:P pilus assembly chaperone PapD
MNFARKLPPCTLAALLLTSLSQPAAADLMLFPTRVVIEQNQRAAQVELINRGTQPETYRITLVNRRMTETGEIVPAGEPQLGERFAYGMVRYSPRQVTLQPGVAQTVRISVRRPADLEQGEYRSHLQFDRVPDVTGESDLETLHATTAGEIGVVVHALIGASIPLIVRHGATSAAAELSELELIEDVPGAAPQLRFSIARSGNRSVYGDLLVTYTRSAGESPVQVGRVDGVAVYVPNDLRRATLPLTLPPGTTLSGGVLRISYSERPEAGRKVIAEAELALR